MRVVERPAKARRRVVVAFIPALVRRHVVAVQVHADAIYPVQPTGAPVVFEMMFAPAGKGAAMIQPAIYAAQHRGHLAQERDVVRRAQFTGQHHLLAVEVGLVQHLDRLDAAFMARGDQSEETHAFARQLRRARPSLKTKPLKHV